MIVSGRKLEQAQPWSRRYGRVFEQRIKSAQLCLGYLSAFCSGQNHSHAPSASPGHDNPDPGLDAFVELCGYPIIEPGGNRNVQSHPGDRAKSRIHFKVGAQKCAV